MKLRLILLLAVGSAALAALLAAAAPLASQILDDALFRYPGSALITVEQLDLADLKRGWISRQAVYRTSADLQTTLEWYSERAPGARTRITGNCVTVSQRQAILHGQRTVSVLLCSLAPGTHIMVNEELYVSP